MPDASGPEEGRAAAVAAPTRSDAPSEDGIFDYIVKFEESSQVFNRTYELIAAETVAVGSELQTLAARLERLSASPPDGNTARQYRTIGLKAAKSIDGYNARLEELLQETEAASNAMIVSGTEWAQTLAVQTDPANIAEAREAARTLMNTLAETQLQTEEFRENVMLLQGITAPLTKASHRAIKAVDRLLAVAGSVEAFAERVLYLLSDDTDSEQSGLGT